MKIGIHRDWLRKATEYRLAVNILIISIIFVRQDSVDFEMRKNLICLAC